MTSNLSPRFRPSWQIGFSMIEVLVTLVIISLALLGTVGLQAYAMRVNQGGQFRTQAVFLASDLAERMEANRAAAVSGGYVRTTRTVAASTENECVVDVCTRNQLAAFDLAQWENMVAATLPRASWTVTQTTTGNPSVYTITIGWVDRRSEATAAAYDASTGLGSNEAGTGERFFYTATRLVFDSESL